ncbi:MAG: hypothetical protein KGY80_13310 [Candidatus Thorarchaeota archaeon]|nr:hypothetical protein [Candidatus Thorarchaeota archaeon]
MKNDRKYRGIVLLIMLLALPFLVPSVGAGNSYEMVEEPVQEAQKYEISQTREIPSVQTPVNDSAAKLFVETDWNTKIPSRECISRTNGSLGSSASSPKEAAPFLSAPSVLNTSEYNSSSCETETLTSSTYFPGHTWSWEYGPDDRHVEAPEVTRPMEGNWFPKKSYSRIVYQVLLEPRDDEIYFHVERGADTYARYFRVFLDDEKLHEHIIQRSSNHYSASIPVPDDIRTDYYYITLEIYYGGYKEKGWNLRYFTVKEPDYEGYLQPVRTDYQQFRKEGHSDLVFNVPMGPNTKLNIETLNCHDWYTRYLYVYVDGYRKKTHYAPGSYEADIGDYSEPGMHELKLVLYWGDHFYGAYSKSIKQLYVSYEYRHVEVDWMAGWYQGTYYDHSQPPEVFEYAESYYRTHDYRRVKFHEDECVGFEAEIPDYDYFKDNYYDVHFDHIGDSRWAYGLFAHDTSGGYWGQGLINQGFYVTDKNSPDLNHRKWVLMHEFGHVEAMDDGSGYKRDVYCIYDREIYSDWVTPHYASNGWVHHLTWISGWW